MKFFFADNMDNIDPYYDFINDRHAENRKPYWDDQFAHEFFESAPYDGILVSRAVMGGANTYTESQSMRFRRIGAREFLRFNKNKDITKPIMGDNGAFSYSNLKQPPFTVLDTVEFYADGRFTHGCSVDHIIFEFDSNAKGMNGGSDVSRERFEITQQLASDFYTASKKIGNGFTPIGVIQGWSPDSLAIAAKNLVGMGYKYLALGGLVPLSTDEIHRAVSSVQSAIDKWPNIKLHLLGFAKAGKLHEFKKYKSIASFDSTSPLTQAFKDQSNNYYSLTNSGEVKFYSAIRVPQAFGNNKMKNHVKTGRYAQEQLIELESQALTTLRAFDKGSATVNETLDAVIEYSIPLLWAPNGSKENISRKLHTLRVKYEKTLLDRPWKKCTCRICKECSIEAIIFRASNRNKRRGFHNLHVFYNHLNSVNSQ